MILLIYIKQQLINISGSIHEKVKQHWGWVERSVAYKKKACLRLLRYFKINLLILVWKLNNERGLNLVI